MQTHTVTTVVAALFLASSVFGHTVGLRLLLLAIGIVFAALALARSKGEVKALPPISLAFILWAAWAALSIGWSIEPERSVKEFRNEVFYTAAALWVCFIAAQGRHAARIFPPVLAAAALGACAIAIRHFWHNGNGYQTGWHGGPGDHSSALLTLMPCAVMAGWYAMRNRRPLWIASGSWALAALLFASAYTTLNRTIWFGFAAQFLLLGALIAIRGRTPAPAASAAWTKTAAGVLAFAAVAASAALVLTVQAQREAVGAAHALERDPRFTLWPEVTEHIGERPLTGYGFGRGLLREPLQQELRTLDPNLWHAHNLFLDALLQTGLPGLALLLVLLAVILREAWRFARDANDWTAACSIALIGVVVGMLVRNLTDTLLVRQNALLYWGVVGVLLAWSSRPWRASS